MRLLILVIALACAVYGKPSENAKVPGECIVMLKAGQRGLQNRGPRVKKAFNIRNMYALLIDADCDKIGNDGNIAFKEDNTYVKTTVCSSQDTGDGLWGLDKISSRILSDASMQSADLSGGQSGGQTDAESDGFSAAAKGGGGGGNGGGGSGGGGGGGKKKTPAPTTTADPPTTQAPTPAPTTTTADPPTTQAPTPAPATTTADPPTTQAPTPAPATTTADPPTTAEPPTTTPDKYWYSDDEIGTGVDVYILDTGIYVNHTAFEGRARHAYTTYNAGGDEDNRGHGTHVAGTVGSGPYGVAKDVELLAVKVLDDNGGGTASGIILGIEFAVDHHNNKTNGRKSVINMSLSGSKSSTINTAVAQAVESGIPVVVSAGNSAADACNYSPASEPKAITVGASTISDAVASYSNYGSCVDIFAPGSLVLSAAPNDGTATKSGTSMAAPHVTGVVARYLSYFPSATPTQIDAWLKDTANKDVLTNMPAGTSNRLAYAACDLKNNPPQ